MYAHDPARTAQYLLTLQVMVFFSRERKANEDPSWNRDDSLPFERCGLFFQRANTQRVSSTEALLRRLSIPSAFK